MTKLLKFIFPVLSLFLFSCSEEEKTYQIPNDANFKPINSIEEVVSVWGLRCIKTVKMELDSTISTLYDFGEDPNSIVESNKMAFKIDKSEIKWYSRVDSTGLYKVVIPTDSSQTIGAQEILEISKFIRNGILPENVHISNDTLRLRSKYPEFENFVEYFDSYYVKTYGLNLE